MKSLNECILEYKNQLRKEEIIKAHRGLMEYMMGLRTYFSKKYPEFIVPGNMYQGYMDMTYFSVIPPQLKSKKLKIAVVITYPDIIFEVWLSGVNKQVQEKYWKLIKEKGWNKYRIPASVKGYDSILEHSITESPDFNNLDALTSLIEKSTISFIHDVVKFLGE